MGKVLAGITISVDGFITGPATALAAGSGSAASACITGCSANPWNSSTSGVRQPPFATFIGYRVKK